ncbi:starch synthase 3, chloroplastic/amyloplastic-like isoform X3 [Silene latifolia]
MAKKSVSLSCTKLLKELESVRGFIEEGKSSNDTVYNKSEFIEEGKSGLHTVYDTFGLEAADLSCDEANSTVSKFEALGSETTDLEDHEINNEKEDSSMASQVNRIEEEREDLGGTKKEVGESSMAKKSVSLSCTKLLKELESVRGFIEEGKSSNDNVYNKSEFIEEGKSGLHTVHDTFGLEAADLSRDEANSTVSKFEALGSETTDLEDHEINNEKEDSSMASQVNRIEEQREDLGGTKKKVGESSMAKKSVSLSCTKLLKELESVRGFIEERKSSNDTVYNKSEFIEEGKSGLHTVYDKFGLEAADLSRDEANSTVSKFEALGSETTDLEDHEIINEKEDSSIYEENLDLVNQEKSETGPSYTITSTSDEMESEGVATFQESPVMVSYQNAEAGSYGTITTALALDRRVFAITPYDRKVKDIISIRKKFPLVKCQSMESDTNVTATGVMGSVTSSDTISRHEMEVPDLTQENFAPSEECPEADDSVLKMDMGETLRKLEMEKEREESLRKLEMEKERKESLRKLEMEKEREESLRKLELEREALIKKQAIEQLAEVKFSKGDKMFIYPEIVKPDEEIEVFLNRNLSSLDNEPDVIIMGAFNDWRWKSFTIKLEKSHLNGDWWSCRIHVPREAYIINFVFFNGKDVYDNNNKKDFNITVEEGMDKFAFEDLLLEEKRRELDKLAKVEAERVRQAEEQKRMKEEKAASEADRAHAKVQVEQRREQLRGLVRNAISSKENVWYFEPRAFQDGDFVRLFYNKSSGPLTQAHELWVHGGHNGWAQGLSVVSRLVKSEDNADWWYAEVIVPDQAIVLDWVFANGPPQQASLYDNNNRQDFHATVPKSIPDEHYWVEEEERIYKRLQQERRSREEAIRVKAEKTARMKAEIKERTLKTFLLSQRHIVYTDPVDVKAGQYVTVYYNPSNTVLNGKPDVWFRGSFNRWTHRGGPLPPQKMVPVENCSHVKTTVKVPLDAYMMDFVFSEREDGGIFDNKSRMDYHVPVFGGIAKEPPMHIVHIAVEMAPIAKVGGLGDVVTSLSRAIQELNHHVDIILPKYGCLNLDHVKDFHYKRSYPWGGIEIKVWSGKVEGLSVYFLEPQNGLFQSNSVYIGRNDGERFGFFCHAALEFLLQSGFHPDIIHCHDWTSAPVAWLYKEHYGQYGLTNARVVFTIHNLEFGAYFIGRAMAYADKATTVSNTYSKEIAGNPAIAPHLGKFHGILNGIDPDIWDPYNDKFIPVPYTSEDFVDGKRAAKEALQQRFSIKKGDFPIIGIITRLTHQKGIHLIKHAIWRTIERGGQIVLLGTAPDPRIQREFIDLSNQLHNIHHDRARLCLTYDEPLSHLIYAGADFILVPSVFEPCGLTQLVAMKYGAIPVVRKTGGLYDTVFDVDHDIERAKAQGLEPNGFNFEGADQAGVDYAINRAITCWYDAKEWLNSLRKRVMEQDWSWNRPALEYMELYHAARKY